MNDFKIKTIKPQSGFKNHQAKKTKKIPYTKIVIGILILIGGYFLFTKVLSTVDVVLIPKTTELKKDFQITLSTSVEQPNIEEKIFPAQIIEHQQSLDGEFKAEGEKDIGDKASGEAVFYNQTGRPQPVTTKIDLINDAGKIFRLTEDITIPGAKVDEEGEVVAGEISATIEALEPGEEGNAGAGRINISALVIEMQEKIYGQITSGLGGGTSEIVKVVSQEDIDRAREELFNQMRAEVEESLKEKAGKSYVILDELINYDTSDIIKEVEIDQPAENFKLTLNLKAQALAHDQHALKKALKQEVEQELNDNQAIPDNEFGNFEFDLKQADYQNGLADLGIKATYQVSEKVNLEEIKQNILGKEKTQARRYILRQENIRDVRFVFSLGLSNTIPENPKKVEVKLNKDE